MTTDPTIDTIDAESAQFVRALTTAANQPEPIDPNGPPVAFLVPDGYRLDVHDPWRERSRERDGYPERKTGRIEAHTAEALAQYTNDHSIETATTLYADVQQLRLTAVLNGHTRGGDEEMAGWGDHRVGYQCPTTDEWDAWLGINGQLVDQSTLAEHLEEYAHTVIEPDAATMVELARTFEATTGAQFRSAVVLESGERALHYAEDTEAKAGKKGDIKIPDRLHLALTPFEGGTEAFKIEARFRYRLREGSLTLGVQLLRVNEVIRQAFDAQVEVVEAATDLTALRAAAPY